MRDDLSPAGIIIEHDEKLAAVQQAQQLAEIKNAAIRHAARMAEFKKWVSPEEIAMRVLRHAEEAAAALEKTKAMIEAMGGAEEDIPLPDNLPDYMKDQPMSTIKAFLRHEKKGFDPLVSKKKS